MKVISIMMMAIYVAMAIVVVMILRIMVIMILIIDKVMIIKSDYKDDNNVHNDFNNLIKY